MPFLGYRDEIPKMTQFHAINIVVRRPGLKARGTSSARRSVRGCPGLSAPYREPLAALLEWQAMAEGAYSAKTLRAQKAGGAIFQAFCESRGEPYLPAAPKTIRAFIEDRVKAGKKPATIRRYVATASRVHTAAGLLNPRSSEAVHLGSRKWVEKHRHARIKRIP
jgi:hypothetical protein